MIDNVWVCSPLERWTKINLKVIVYRHFFDVSFISPIVMERQKNPSCFHKDSLSYKIIAWQFKYQPRNVTWKCWVSKTQLNLQANLKGRKTKDGEETNTVPVKAKTKNKTLKNDYLFEKHFCLRLECRICALTVKCYTTFYLCLLSECKY